MSKKVKIYYAKGFKHERHLDTFTIWLDGVPVNEDISLERAIEWANEWQEEGYEPVIQQYSLAEIKATNDRLNAITAEYAKKGA